MSDESRMMTVPELAARIGIDASTAYRYLRAGQLPGVQVGSSWLIDRERVERFLAGQEDAEGRALVERPADGPAAALTLLPERVPDAGDLALQWLRGAHAALDLLLGSAAERIAPERDGRDALGA